jgi:hypothetical protein
MPDDNDPPTTTPPTSDGEFKELDRRVSEALHRIGGAMLAVEDAEAALQHVRNFVGEWVPPEDPVIAFADALSEAADCLKSAHDGDLYEAFKAVEDGLEDFEKGLADEAEEEAKRLKKRVDDAELPTDSPTTTDNDHV